MPVLIDEALRLHAASFEQLGIRVERDYAPVPLLSVDRHKLQQILVNLLSNARHALMDSPRKDKRLSIGIQPAPDGERGHASRASEPRMGRQRPSQAMPAPSQPAARDPILA